MKKLMMIGVVLACATLISGCGNSHEKVVNDFYRFLSVDGETLHEVSSTVVTDGFFERNEKMRMRFAEFAGRRLIVKTEIIDTFKNSDVNASVIRVTYQRKDGSYGRFPDFFVVGSVKGGKDKIMFITREESEALAFLPRYREEMGKRKW